MRLFKGFLKAMVDRIQEDASLKHVTATLLMRKAATIRNTQVTFSGKSPTGTGIRQKAEGHARSCEHGPAAADR